MSHLGPSEERYPLLLLFLEDGQRSSKQYKRIAIDKNRYRGITSGASAVITQWPGHLTSCWLTAIFMGLLLLLLTITMFALSLRPSVQFLTSRCRIRHMDGFETDNVGVIHLTHTCNPWTETQLSFLESLAQSYPKMAINLIMVQSKPNSTFTGFPFMEYPAVKLEKLTEVTVNQTVTVVPVKKSKRSVMRKANKKTFNLIINIGTQKLLKLLLEKRNLNNTAFSRVELTTLPPVKINTIKKLLESFPNIKVIHTTYANSFRNTPLSLTWYKLNEVTQLFAIRVLQLWNFGGISFDIPGEPGRLDTPDLMANFKKLIRKGDETFGSLPDGLVTVDNEGFHMETKTICHAFFAEMLVGLRDGNRLAIPEDIVSGALKKFCKRGAVDQEYCKKIEMPKLY